MKAGALTGAVLLGGASRRMGQDKANLELAGLPLWKSQAAKLLAVGCGEVLLSVHAGQLAGVALQPKLKRVEDESPDAGPLAGLVACLCRAGRSLLILPVDMPGLTEPLLRKILAHSEGKSHPVVLSAGGRLQPLVGLYPFACLPTLEEALAGGMLSPTQILTTRLDYGVVELGDDDSAMQNLNTPAEWTRWRKAVGERSSGPATESGGDTSHI